MALPNRKRRKLRAPIKFEVNGREAHIMFRKALYPGIAMIGFVKLDDGKWQEFEAETVGEVEDCIRGWCAAHDVSDTPKENRA